MDEHDRQAIMSMFDTYVRAFVRRDADVMQRLFWLDDDRFTEIEDHIQRPFGRDTFLKIMDWMRDNPRADEKRAMAFHDPEVMALAPDVAYSVALQEIITPRGTSISRVTLIYLKRDNEWRIIHGHFSALPE